jgi:hypothetical protein
MASADSQVRPEPRPLTILPRPTKTREAGPEAYPHPPCRLGAPWWGIWLGSSDSRDRQVMACLMCWPLAGSRCRVVSDRLVRALFASM